MKTEIEMTEKLSKAQVDISYGERLAAALFGMVKDKLTRRVVTYIPGLGRLMTFYDYTGITDRFLSVD